MIKNNTLAIEESKKTDNMKKHKKEYYLLYVIIIICLLAHTCSAQPVLQSGKIKVTYNSIFEGWNSNKKPFYKLKATHFSFRFNEENMSFIDKASIDVKFFNSTTLSDINEALVTDSNSIARISYAYKDSTKKKESQVFFVFRPKPENRSTSYTTLKRTMQANVQLAHDTAVWELSWSGIPIVDAKDTAFINPQKLFLTHGSDTVESVSSFIQYSEYEWNGCSIYLNKVLIARLTQKNSSKYSYTIYGNMSELEKQKAYAFVSLFCMIVKLNSTYRSYDE